MEKITIGLIEDDFTGSVVFIGDSTQLNKKELSFIIEDRIEGVDNDFKMAVSNEVLYDVDSDLYVKWADYVSDKFERVIFPKHIFGAYVLLNDEPDERESAYFSEEDCEGGELSASNCQGKIYIRKIFEEEDEIIEERCCISNRKAIKPI
jgi:hypothetical protein